MDSAVEATLSGDGIRALRSARVGLTSWSAASSRAITSGEAVTFGRVMTCPSGCGAAGQMGPAGVTADRAPPSSGRALGTVMPALGRATAVLLGSRVAPDGPARQLLD